MTASARLRRAAALTAVAAATLVTLTACAFAPTGSDAGSAPATEGALQTVAAGKLTIATGEPAFSPWVENDDPASCQGFEAAVSCAVAEKLGFTKDDIVWVRSNFDSAIAPGPKDWDMNVQQFSITDQRKQAVDFSSPYYTTTQAIVTTGTSPAASATTVAELKNIPVGVMSATTSYQVAADQLGTATSASSTPTTTPSPPSSRARSMRSSSTCRPRSTSPGPCSTTARSWASCPTPRPVATSSPTSCPRARP